MEPLESREITFGDVTFRIGKMLPMEAKRVFMSHVRPMLRGALSAEVSEDANGWKIILAAFTDAPQEHYDALTKALYRNITFTSSAVKTPTVLAGDEEIAFEGLDMAHSLMLDVRAFYVNFFGSWDALTREFPLLKQVSL